MLVLIEGECEKCGTIFCREEGYWLDLICEKCGSVLKRIRLRVVKVMAGALKKHEVDRLMNVAVALGWVLKDERLETFAVEVVLRREFSKELIEAVEPVVSVSGPQ